MTNARVDEVMAAMRTVEDPEVASDLVALNIVRGAEVSGADVALTVVLTTPACPYRDEIEGRIREALGRISWIGRISLKFSAEVASNKGSDGAAESLPGIRNAIAVASGKGGVGKTTVAVNLSVALARHGAKVGLLDADVYGPNVPIMMGVKGDPVTVQGQISPLEAKGVKLMSLGLMLEDSTPVIWRGPMIAGALKQLLRDVAWGEVDYLIIDLPPGTGDASLTLAQLIPLAGAVIVSTPQEVALQDVRRSIAMFERLNVPVLGIVENMSYYIHVPTGERVEIFGHGGAARAAETLGLEFLGEIPLDPVIREGGDTGKPVAADESSPLAGAFMRLAGKVAAGVSVRNLKEQEEALPML